MKAEDLRKAILQAAVQGELVSQNSNDEPASELLKQVQAEKAQLIKDKKIKVAKPLPAIKEDEIPYKLPVGWEWCRIGTFGIIRGGKRIPTGMSFSTSSTKYIYLRVTDMKNGTIVDSSIKYIDENVYKLISKYTISSNDIYITIAGTIGNCGIVPARFDNVNLTENAAKLTLSVVNKQYILTAIQSEIIISQFCKKTNQMAQPKLALERIATTLIPLPPLEEQKRIVAKVEELMVFCDELEASEKELDNLEKHFLEYLPKSILQAAVQGKLVPQNSKDEPASELLKQIQAEKAQLIKDKKIKVEKPLPAIKEDEIPYEVPEGWEWSRIGNCIQLLSGQDLETKYFNSEGHGIPYITGASAIRDATIIVNRWTTSPSIISQVDDLLITCKGTIGKLAFNTLGNCHIARQIMAIRFTSKNNIKEYVKIFLEGHVSQLTVQAKSMIPGISREHILQSLFPLPPLEEQKRIVAKVKELMSMCEELKKTHSTPIEYKESHVIPFLQPEGKVESIGIAIHKTATKVPNVVK